MRRTLIFLAALSALALLGSASPADGGETYATLDITKVVEGDGPTGGFLIRYDCEVLQAGAGAEGSASDVLAFDAAGPGSPETQTVNLPGAAFCEVEEIESNGAESVTYACEHVPGTINSPPDEAQTEGFDDGCQSDREVNFLSFQSEGTITVTNTFADDVEPDVEEPDVVADVVAATPSFTG